MNKENMPPNFIEYDLIRILEKRNFDKIKFPEKILNLYQEEFGDDIGKRVIFISGPNGVGKDTILNSFLFNEISQSVFDIGQKVMRFPRTTSRQKRNDEHEGFEYLYRSEEYILDNWQNYIAMTRYPANNQLYAIDGIKMSEALLSTDDFLIFGAGIDFTPALKKFFPDSVSIYILPPSLAELERRLVSRDGKKPDLMDRIEVGERELITVYASLYTRNLYVKNMIDYIVVNDSLEKSVSDFTSIISDIVLFDCDMLLDPLDLKHRYHEIMTNGDMEYAL